MRFRALRTEVIATRSLRLPLCRVSQAVRICVWHIRDRQQRRICANARGADTMVAPDR